MPAAIAATFELAPGRYPGGEPFDMHRDVAVRALQEWNLPAGSIDGLLTAPAGMSFPGRMDVFAHEKLHEELGLRPRHACTVNSGGSSYGIMLRQAVALIDAGEVESVLLLGAGKFANVGAGGDDALALARLVSEPDFELVYGPFIPAIYALAASVYLATYGADGTDLAAVAVAARQWATKNPLALKAGAGELTIEDVLSSRMIATPFHLLDCSIPCEGGGALLVTSLERARDLTDRPAVVLGTGECHTHSTISQAPDLLHSGAAAAGAMAFDRAGLTPSDIDVVELYDPFTVSPLILLEDIGFCAPGTAGAFVRDGATQPGGRLPMNTGGGLLSFGHTGDSSGLTVMVEGARQIMGTAASPLDPQRVLIHTYGGMMSSHATAILAAA